MDMKYKIVKKDNYIAQSSFDEAGDRKGVSIELLSNKYCRIGEFIGDLLNGYCARFDSGTIEAGKMKESQMHGICVRYYHRYKSECCQFGYYNKGKFETGFIVFSNGNFNFITKNHSDFIIEYDKDYNYGQFGLYNKKTRSTIEAKNYVKFDTKIIKRYADYDLTFKNDIKLNQIVTDSYIYEGETSNQKEDGIGIRYHLDDYEVMLKDEKGVTRSFMQKKENIFTYNLGTMKLMLFSDNPSKGILIFRNFVLCINGSKFEAYFNCPGQLPSSGFSTKHNYYRITFTKDLQILIDEMLDNEVLKMGIYNVKFKSVCKSKPIEYQVNEDADKYLDNLVGLTNVKKKINRIKSYILKNKNNKLNLHMAFLGNPGTGKTEVAKLLNDIFFKYGVLPTPKLINTDRSGLVGPHIGDTAKKTNDIINKAMGGILFIDEAYALCNPSKKDFGNEAIVELLKQMEDHKGEFCCILAGYKDDMYKLFDMNPGFKSRIQYIIDFEDFTEEELLEIAIIFIKKNKVKVDSEILAKLVSILKYQKETLQHFGNARDVRNLIEQVSMIAASRDNYDGRILMEDIAIYMNENTITEKRIARVPNVDFIELNKFYQETFKPMPYKEGKYDIYESLIQIYNNYDKSTARKSGFVFSPDGYAITVDLNINECVNANAVRHIFDRSYNRIRVTNSVSVAADYNGISVIQLDKSGGRYTYLPMLEINLSDYINKPLLILGTTVNENKDKVMAEYDGDCINITEIKDNEILVFKYNRDINYMDGSIIVDPDTSKVIALVRGQNTAISINRIIKLLK